jgi:hypothetical protein
MCSLNCPFLERKILQVWLSTVCFIKQKEKKNNIVRRGLKGAAKEQRSQPSTEVRCSTNLGQLYKKKHDTYSLNLFLHRSFFQVISLLSNLPSSNDESLYKGVQIVCCIIR